MRYSNIFFIIQLVLVFFAPPIAFKNRSIFLSDLWCWAWVSYWILDMARVQGPRKTMQTLSALLPISALLLCAYAHGAFRPEVMKAVRPDELFILGEPEAFQPGRELVVALRFLSWIWAAFLASKTILSERTIALLRRTLWGCLLFGVGALALQSFSPQSERWLSSVYGYDPKAYYWQGRAYGAFRSPVEAAITLAFCVVLLWRPKKRFSNLFLLALLLISVWLTHTATALIAALVALTAMQTHRHRKKIRLRELSALALIAAASLAWVSYTGYLHSKLGDFAFRTRPWKLYLSFLFSRLDYAFLGFGFVPYHTDSIYVFLLTRGGALLFAYGLWAFLRQARALRSSPQMAGSIVFVLLAGVTLDLLIYRNVASVIFAFLLPLARYQALHPRKDT